MKMFWRRHSVDQMPLETWRHGNDRASLGARHRSVETMSYRIDETSFEARRHSDEIVQQESKRHSDSVASSSSSPRRSGVAGSTLSLHLRQFIGMQWMAFCFKKKNWFSTINMLLVPTVITLVFPIGLRLVGNRKYCLSFSGKKRPLQKD